MTAPTYTSVPADENSKEQPHQRTRTHSLFSLNPSSICAFSCLGALALICFAVGFYVGKRWESWTSNAKGNAPWEVEREDGLLDPQVIIGQIPRKEVKFEFPTWYDDDGALGDKIWDELMPLGSGFLRVPNPRKYAMPRSKKVENDIEEAEIYSVSMTHQIHCLGVLRDVITKYSRGDKSRFAGDGHEYHCLDYIRQAILCAGDTTLDHAEIEYNPDGSELRYGFSGANATHRCRDWDAIREVLIEKRLDNKTGILF